MLNRFSHALQSAADALAPPAPPLEDLKYHWKLVMRFYAQRSVHSKTPIEETNIPGHLEQLLKILLREDPSSRTMGGMGPCTAAGPCLEFLLQHRLLELLVSLACADSPPGMRRYILGYLRRFLCAIAPHLLTQASIHLPLLRIINLCSQSKASPTESEEIELLVALCQIVHSHPYLSIIFNKEVKAAKPPSISSSASSSCHTLNQPQEVCQTLADVELGGSEKVANYSTSSRTESSSSDFRAQTDIVRQSAGDSRCNDVSRSSSVPLTCSSNTACEGECNQSELRNYSPSADEAKQEETSSIILHTQHCEKLYQEQTESQRGQGSQAVTRSGTPESLVLPDGEEYKEAEAGEGRLPLLDAVLGYINSADSKTKLRVCEGLLMLVSVADETFSQAIARTSTLGLGMAEKLCSSFHEIPSGIHPDDLEDIPANWGPETSQVWLEQHTFPGSRLVASFVSWLNFCDQLTVESPVDVGDSVACAVRALFFDVELESELRSADSTRKQIITNILCICLRHLTSSALLTELNYWLVGESPDLDSSGAPMNTMKQLLIDHCLHADHRLSLATMRLFELLLENCNEHVLQCLVLAHLSSRGYCDAASPRDKSQMDSWSDEEDAREQERERNGGNEGSCEDPTLNSPESVSRTFAPHNIHKIIDNFLQLLPNGLRSATEYEEAGYQQYVAEAQRQYILNRQHCASFGWASEATFPDDTGKSSDSRPEADHCFNEGPFLRMIFSRLREIASQPYEMNLQLTALISRLSMLPHPYLHEFLLNPLLPLVPGTVSLFSTLQAVASELQTRVTPIPNSKKILVRTRQHLLGDDSHYHDLTQENSCLLESVIVLEEFCKELAAIVYVKYHHSS